VPKINAAHSEQTSPTPPDPTLIGGHLGPIAALYYDRLQPSNIVPLARFTLLPDTTRRDRPTLTFDLEFRFLPQDSRLTCVPHLPNDADSYKNRISDPILPGTTQVASRGWLSSLQVAVY